MTATFVPGQDSQDMAERLNLDCHCVSLDRAALRRELMAAPEGALLAAMIESDRPHLFSGSAVYVSERNLRRMAGLIAAIERVVALPAYAAHVLSYAPPDSQPLLAGPRARGVFLGYDFHLPAQPGQFPQLIEINTNAGGGLLNALLARAQHASCDCLGVHLPGQLQQVAPEQLFMEMFEAEWALERPGQPLRVIALVDETPERQFLYPEFLLFRQLFEHRAAPRLRAMIFAPETLVQRDGGLWCGEERIDLVYNRLTDFSLAAPSLAALKTAWQAGEVVVTPHPRAHALYADKRNLVALCDDARLQQWGVPAATRAWLRAGIPPTRLVVATAAAELWAQRRQWFFKPASGYGSKAAYRGDKLTRRVFEEIIDGLSQTPYIVHQLAPPSSRQIAHHGAEGGMQQLKLDLRHYVYDGRVQLVAARLWQGQTTNFRTPGGGFAPVMAVPCPADGSLGEDDPGMEMGS